MLHTKTKRPLTFYQAIPKVELHRHLEGSIRLNTLIDIGRSHNFSIIGTDFLRPLVQIHEGEPNTFENFLSKFVALREFYRSPDAIARITKEAIEDAAADNIRYLELRFTPVALSKSKEFSLSEVMDWVIAATAEGEKEFGVITRLIASVNRHESVELAEQVIQLAADRKDAGIVGVDLAGSEANFPGAPFIGPFREAQQAGLKLTIHAGEWGAAQNVREAIELFQSERVGHGVRVMENPEIVALARERGTIFEVCVTSNYQSGVVPVLENHPIRQMADQDLQTTINTDDPSVSQISLSYEYQLICETLGLPISKLTGTILRAARAAFLEEDAKSSLIAVLEKQLKKYSPLD